MKNLRAALRILPLAVIAALPLLPQTHPQEKPEEKMVGFRFCRKVHVRRNVASFWPYGSELASLRKGVQVMMGRAPSDPTSWIYQANIHGTYDMPAAPLWNQCQHASFYFFSWHRMYLYYFERILRAAAGDPDLALPYWNYSDAAARTLPLPYRQPADSSNPLYVADRNAT